MSQGLQAIANDSGAAVRAALNVELAALYTQSSGSSAPSTTVAWMMWADTTNNLWKIRDGANANWITVGAIDQTNKIFQPLLGGGSSTIASASTTDIGTVNGTYVTVSGTSSITSFGSTMKAGQMKFVNFSGGLKVVYNATSMITPGAADAFMGIGDMCLLLALGSGNYRIVQIFRANGTRERLIANRTYYVDVSLGSDSNTGLTSGSGGAFATIQYALNFLSRNIDLGGYSVVVQLADGTYTVGANLSAPFTGSGSVIVQGNTGGMNSVIISTTSTAALEVNNHAQITLQYVKLVMATSGNTLRAHEGGLIYFNNVNFGAGQDSHLLAYNDGIILANGDYTVSGGASSHASASYRGLIQTASVSVTISGTPGFGLWANSQNLALINMSATTFTGSPTGTRYFASGNAVVFTGGGGATYLPGNVNGSTATGGQYV